ncbi:reverse transcriptase domain-containing protein [Artemisia annua]|uniref:Reverse transcriptase domain-containing protein n=1 Tax=Artemisia annua TaxID=35608 RepID=A0A2U1PCQ9_ARTAN|nr:reverse transcriptase domain-containing protein [Artemisia annua]
MEDLFTQAHNFIRSDEANAENRLRDSRGAANDNKAGQSYRDASRRQRHKYIPRPNSRPNERNNVHKPSFTPLIKSPAEIYATSEGKAVLRPPPRMFAPAHQRDRTRYCEFHNDHGHDTNDCIDLRKEIEACIKSGRLSHLAKGAKAQSNNQSPRPSGAPERGKNLIDWKQKIVEPKETNEILMTSIQWPSQHYQPEVLPPGTDIAFSGKGGKTITADFMIVQAPSPYNIILGRTGMRRLGAIASTIHSLLKFPIPSGVTIVQGDIPRNNECFQVSQKREREPEEVTTPTPQENDNEKEEVEINSLYPNQKVMCSVPRNISSVLKNKG